MKGVFGNWPLMCPEGRETRSGEPWMFRKQACTRISSTMRIGFKRRKYYRIIFNNDFIGISNATTFHPSEYASGRFPPIRYQFQIPPEFKLIFWPFFLQIISGLGWPSAAHSKTRFWPSIPETSLFEVIIVGGWWTSKLKLSLSSPATDSALHS